MFSAERPGLELGEVDVVVAQHLARGLELVHPSVALVGQDRDSGVPRVLGDEPTAPESLVVGVWGDDQFHVIPQ